MPFVEGESLRTRLDREKQLPVDEALRLATSLASALDCAHRPGVIQTIAVASAVIPAVPRALPPFSYENPKQQTRQRLCCAVVGRPLASLLLP
jgi:hypothetical protein